jgi:hypothetical protein
VLIGRLTLHLIIFAVCGAVAANELYYLLASTNTTATILVVGRSKPPGRNASYWADCEYFDAQNTRFVAHTAWVNPTTHVGDTIEVLICGIFPSGAA